MKSRKSRKVKGTISRPGKPAAKKSSISSWVRAAGEAARAEMRKKEAAAKRKPQTKADLANKFNKRIDQLAGELWTGEKLLPPKITPELVDELSHRELRKLISSATVKKSSGVYQEGQQLLPEFRKSYQAAMLDIINDRRAKRKKVVEKANVRIKGKVQKDEEGKAIKRVQMGDIRAHNFDPIRFKDKFASKNEETYFIKNLPDTLLSERDTLFRDNIVVSLRQQFGDEANDLIEMLYNASTDAVLKAYYAEEYFSIENVYNADRGDREFIEILKNELKRQGVKEPSEITNESRDWSNALLKKSIERERSDFINLNRL